jgi:DNA-binding NtrC family response regulator
MAKAKPEQPRHRRRSLSDPFEAVLRPPPNETQDEREQRLNAEYEAKLVSDGIDQMIANERNAKKKAKAEVKVLILGQSESGKSTTLKRECSFVATLRRSTTARRPPNVLLGPTYVV